MSLISNFSKDYNFYISLGDNALEKKDYFQAIVHYNSALQSCNYDYDKIDNTKLFLCHHLSGNYEIANKYISYELTKDINNLTLQNYRLKNYFAWGKYEKATNILKNKEKYYEVNLINFKEEVYKSKITLNIEKTVNSFISNENVDNFDKLYNLNETSIYENNNILNKNSNNIKKVKNLIKLYPNNTKLILILAIYYFNHNKYALSNELFLKLYNINKSNIIYSYLLFNFDDINFDKLNYNVSLPYNYILSKLKQINDAINENRIDYLLESVGGMAAINFIFNYADITVVKKFLDKAFSLDIKYQNSFKIWLVSDIPKQVKLLLIIEYWENGKNSSALINDEIKQLILPEYNICRKMGINFVCAIKNSICSLINLKINTIDLYEIVDLIIKKIDTKNIKYLDDTLIIQEFIINLFLIKNKLQFKTESKNFKMLLSVFQIQLENLNENKNMVLELKQFSNIVIMK